MTIGSGGLKPLEIEVDRSRSVPIVEQISDTLRTAITEGRLEAGTRLPSWLDMAKQLGVGRGTVKAAYERLADELLVVSAGAAGTRVAKIETELPEPAKVEIQRPLQGIVRGYYLAPLPFQMGVPAQDAFPAKLWARLRARAVRTDAMAPVGTADPRGKPELRAQIASYLAIARGIRCHPDQVFVTSGYRNGLALTLQTLNAHGKPVWMEDPGYPITRKGLELCNMQIVPVPVDSEGMDIARGVALAPNAALAIVTPGQQAPTGVTLSPARRRALLEWANAANGWVIEDDYLSELQLSGRSAPALASEDANGRVIHIGSFGKTLSPALGLGFLVAPLALAERFGEVAACLQPAPNSTTQLALTGFMADGHYLRHLRHMKKLYAERLAALLSSIGDQLPIEAVSGLAVNIRLPHGTDDTALACAAHDYGIAPAPMSVWHYDRSTAPTGLILSVTNLREGHVDRACEKLRALVAQAPSFARAPGADGAGKISTHGVDTPNRHPPGIVSVNSASF